MYIHKYIYIYIYGYTYVYISDSIHPVLCYTHKHIYIPQTMLGLKVFLLVWYSNSPEIQVCWLPGPLHHCLVPQPSRHQPEIQDCWLPAPD